LDIVFGNGYEEGSAGDETGIHGVESPDGFKWEDNGLDNDVDR
jgi:hypothetical protein